MRRGFRRLAGVVRPIGAVTVKRVIPERVIRVIRFLADAAVHVAAGIDEIEVGYLALHGECGLPPPVMYKFRYEVLDFEIANARIPREDTVALLLLNHNARRNCPVLVEIIPQREAGPDRVGVVEIFLDDIVIVYGNSGRREEAGAGHIVDESGVVLVPGDKADGDVFRNWLIDHALENVAEIAVIDVIALHVVAGLKAARIRLIGDDADSARFRTGAVKRALRTGQLFHPRDVVDVHIQGAADGGYRLLIKVDADARQRT